MHSTPDAKHLAALQRHWKLHRSFPSMAKLATTMGLSSTSSVFAALGRLTEAGYLERADGRVAPTKKFFARPILGSVRAGLPQPAGQEEDQFEVLSIDDYLLSHPERSSLVRVKGDSMKDAGMLDGDIAIVEHNSPYGPGDVVVAVVDGGLTVKYLRRDPDGTWFLEAANPEFEPIRPSGGLEILGVVVGSFRRRR